MLLRYQQICRHDENKIILITQRVSVKTFWFIESMCAEKNYID